MSIAKNNFDSIIVGGGIIGLFTAWELAKAGQSVCIVDRGEMGQEASWAAGGILSPLRAWNYPAAVNALALWSQARYQSICEELRETSGIDPQWLKSGMLILDCPEVEQVSEWSEQNKVTLEWLDTESLGQRFPRISMPNDQLGSACWMPDVAQVRNPRLIKALVATLKQMGVKLCSNTEVQALIINHAKVEGVRTSSGDIRGSNTVIAAGAWSKKLIPGEGRFNSLRPVKGQMLLYPACDHGINSIVMQGDRYLVPRADGRVVVGSTVEEAGFDKSTDTATGKALQAFAGLLVPALQGLEPERHWAGLRPATQDEIPVIGPHPELPGCFINAGHYRCGIVTAPISARLLCDRILGRKSLPVDIPAVA